MENKKYLICYRLTGKPLDYLSGIADKIKLSYPFLHGLPKSESLHMTIHEPIIGDHKQDLLEVLKSLSRYEKARVTLGELDVFDENVVVRIYPTFQMARIWSNVRMVIESYLHQDCNFDKSLHVTLLKKPSKSENVLLLGLNESFPVKKDFNFFVDEVSLLEKAGNSNWVEIQRLPLVGKT